MSRIVRHFTLYYWLFLGWTLCLTSGEDFLCNNQNECLNPIICSDANTDCNIICMNNSTCANYSIYVSSSSNGILNLTCDGNFACKNIKLISNRQGIVTCNNFEETCINSNITLINTFSVPNFTTSFNCYGSDTCKNTVFYCEDSDECEWYCDETQNCGNGGNYEFTCKGAPACTLSGATDAWVCFDVTLFFLSF